MERREPEAIAWLEGRADELGAVLAQFETFEAPIAVRTTGSLRELVGAWRTSLVAGRRTLSWALARAAKELNKLPFDAQRFPDVDALVCDSQRASAAWRTLYRERTQDRSSEVLAFGVTVRKPALEWSVAGRPGAATCAKHLKWCAAFGSTRPSPWGPFLAMFERGAWPVPCAGGLFVFVPVRADTSIDASGELLPAVAPVIDTLVDSASELEAIAELRRVGAPCPPLRFARGAGADARPLACLRYSAFDKRPEPEPRTPRSPDKGRLREISDQRTKEMRADDEGFEDDE